MLTCVLVFFPCVSSIIDMLDWDSLIDSRADTSHLLVVPDVEVGTGGRHMKTKSEITNSLITD